MTKDKDYRNTQYCPVFNNIDKKKRELEEIIKSECPRTKITYNKVRDRKGKYHEKFAEIYNKKCAYCGALWELLPVESFEVDHFINEDAFPKSTEGRAEAGRMENLVWSCISCNRGKHEITIQMPYENILNADNGNITNVFFRDEDFNIKICDTYQEDEFIQNFYKKLHLGYESRRLDYLGLQLRGRYLREKDKVKKSQLGHALSILMRKRNMMKTISETEA